MGKSTIGKGTTGKALIRCAIYTRKSSEDGLEQDFNSLDAPGLFPVRIGPPPLAHDGRKRFERAQEGVQVEPAPARFRLSRLPPARIARMAEPDAIERATAARHHVDRRAAILVLDVRPLRDVLATAGRAAQEPSPRVRFLQFCRRAALVFIARRRGGDQPPGAAIGRHAVDQLAEHVLMEDAQRIHDHDLGGLWTTLYNL